MAVHAERSVAGMVLMLLNGLLNTAMVVSGRFAREIEWPYYRLVALSAVVTFVCFALAAYVSRASLPDAQQFKWLVLRGLFGSIAFILMVTSLRLGASPGDAAAMASINALVAALLGRAMLGEALQSAHGVGVLCSTAGAILICRPGFLFGTANAAALLGYFVAACSGFMQACIPITARKSQGTSLLMLNMSPALFYAVSLPLLTGTSMLEDFHMNPVWDEPALGMGMVGLFAIVLMAAICTNTAGSVWCPAAVSATMNTGSKLLWGYLAQMFIFKTPLEAGKVLGAALMLISIAVIGSAKANGPQQPAGSLLDIEAAGTDHSTDPAPRPSLTLITQSLRRDSILSDCSDVEKALLQSRSASLPNTPLFRRPSKCKTVPATYLAQMDIIPSNMAAASPASSWSLSKPSPFCGTPNAASPCSSWTLPKQLSPFFEPANTATPSSQQHHQNHLQLKRLLMEC
mmetsp:Transcript_48976/g.116473  ORF Transcript_48976/g.116473 Transcript_48976/m.116473 type:complete len:460 (-) Transcript_48976:170-1549(-)